MAAKKPQMLTRAESAVMRVLWRLKRATVHETQKELGKRLAYTTVLSVLQLLERKGYVTHQSHEDGGRAHVFVPKLSEAQARKVHTRDLVDRLFDGAPDALVCGVLETESMSRAELQRLRERIDSLLDDAEEDK